jgi:hypothetical protein
MTLLYHDPSTQSPWAKTIVGLACSDMSLLLINLACRADCWLSCIARSDCNRDQGSRRRGRAQSLDLARHSAPCDRQRSGDLIHAQ